MTTRPSSQLHLARRLTFRNELVREGMTEMAADAWVAAWEEERPTPLGERDERYWTDGLAWITSQRTPWKRRS